jgi:hypothetical protein
LIGDFCSVWFYGHGYLAPIYYGILFGIAVWLRNRFELAWTGKRPLIFFVVGISLGYGAICAALVSSIFLFMSPSGSINVIFLTSFLLNVYSGLTLLRSVVFTWRNELEPASRLIKRGLFLTAPSIFLLIFFASNFGV